MSNEETPKADYTAYSAKKAAFTEFITLSFQKGNVDFSDWKEARKEADATEALAVLKKFAEQDDKLLILVLARGGISWKPFPHENGNESILALLAELGKKAKMSANIVFSDGLAFSSDEELALFQNEVVPQTLLIFDKGILLNNGVEKKIVECFNRPQIKGVFALEQNGENGDFKPALNAVLGFSIRNWDFVFDKELSYTDFDIPSKKRFLRTMADFYYTIPLTIHKRYPKP